MPQTDTLPNGLQQYDNSQEAAMGLSQSTYTGTVEPAAQSGSLEEMKSSAEAAMSLSQSTYTGTVEPAVSLDS